MESVETASTIKNEVMWLTEQTCSEATALKHCSNDFSTRNVFMFWAEALLSKR